MLKDLLFIQSSNQKTFVQTKGMATMSFLFGLLVYNSAMIRIYFN
ncbi:hypothetical protein AO375_0221 [Moraxella catarrhalis]|nr:hypothetical protein AO375_0221 [Moraxella catarrhalis]